MTKIAVLALQGAFVEHENILHQLGVSTFQIRKLSDLNKSFDALIIPGGESTAIGKIINDQNMLLPLQEFINSQHPVMGTCAGLILLASKVYEGNYDNVGHNGLLATMDISVKRNAYGRQLGSFNAISDMENIGKNIPMTFIRAPYIDKVWGRAEALSTVDGRIVAARQDKQLALTFHPELDEDLRIHEYFVGLI